MANTKYLNQVKLTTTFTPSNTAIVASDDGQVVAEKAQGQINALTPPMYTINITSQTFTSNGTYTPTTGMVYCTIECWGAGGGGGGSTFGSGTCSTGGGGGAGGYSKKTVAAATIGASQTVTIGALGTGGGAGNNNGNAGTDTSVGTICIAKGGSGGFGAAASNSGSGGAGGTAGTGDIAAPGENGTGGTAASISSVAVRGGYGGNTDLGSGGAAGVATSGFAGTGHGTGGGGASSISSASAAGGNGTAGYVAITEYVLVTTTPGTALNISGGVANDIPYQTAPSTTSFISPAANAVLASNGSSVPSMVTTLPGVNSGSTLVTDPKTSSSATLNTALSDIYGAIPVSTGFETVFNGIEDATQYSVTYSAANRQFSITTTANAAYTVGGVRYVPGATTATTTAHANTAGTYYCYYGAGGVLTVSSTSWNLLLTAPIAIVYYNPSNAGGAAAGILQYELHPGITGMDNATHLNLHTTRGTQLLSGCVASGYTLNTGGAANVNWTTTAGSIADEDLVLTVASQALGGANTYRILYLTGTTAAPVWNWVDTAQYGLYHNGTDIYYNQNNAGTWQLTAITSNVRWTNYYIVATNAYNTPQIIVVMGQNLYTSLANAQAGTFGTDCANFGLFTSEAVVLYKVTYQRSNAAGAPGNAEISAFTQIIQNLIITALTAATQASNVSVNTSTFTNFFTAADNNVQQALNDIDAGFPISLTHGGTGKNLTASNGGIFYSSATTGEILAGTATANKALLSGSSTAPSWSTATYPATTTANQILYSSSANTIAGLSTANSSVLVTSGAGVPSLSTTLPAVEAGSCTCTDPTTSSSASINTALANINGLAGSGGLTLVASSAPSAASSVTFTGLSPGIFYYLIISYKQNTSNGYPRLRFNSDTGATAYNNTSFYYYSGGISYYASGTTSAIQLTNAAGLVDANAQYFGWCDFTTYAGDNTKVFLTCMRTYITETLWVSGGGNGIYNGGSNLSTLTLSPSAGTITGNVRLYKRN